MMFHNFRTLLVYHAGSALLLLAFSAFRFMQLFPRAQWILSAMMDKIATIQMPHEDYMHSLFTWHMFTSMRSSILLELQKSSSRGNLAPDSQLISVDGKSRRSLLSFCRGHRPLVVNFCSWTCPVFRARADEFLSIARELSDVADFLTVYTEEAHPCDGWAFKVSTVHIKHVIDCVAPLPSSPYISWRYCWAQHSAVFDAKGNLSWVWIKQKHTSALHKNSWTFS